MAGVGVVDAALEVRHRIPFFRGVVGEIVVGEVMVGEARMAVVHVALPQVARARRCITEVAEDGEVIEVPVHGSVAAGAQSVAGVLTPGADWRRVGDPWSGLHCSACSACPAV